MDSPTKVDPAELARAMAQMSRAKDEHGDPVEAWLGHYRNMNDRIAQELAEAWSANDGWSRLYFNADGLCVGGVWREQSYGPGDHGIDVTKDNVRRWAWARAWSNYVHAAHVAGEQIDRGHEGVQLPIPPAHHGLEGGPHEKWREPNWDKCPQRVLEQTKLAKSKAAKEMG